MKSKESISKKMEENNGFRQGLKKSKISKNLQSKLILHSQNFVHEKNVWTVAKLMRHMAAMKNFSKLPLDDNKEQLLKT